MSPSVEVLPTTDDLVRAAAERIVSVVGESVKRNGRSMIALSGGSTPRNVYKLLGSEEFSARVPWNALHLFWSDERCVAPEHADSNYKMVKEALLDVIDIPPANVHRIRGERIPTEAARAYEQGMKHLFGSQDTSVPDFDLVLLGLGEDGHTASLFPGTTALQEKDRLVTDLYVDKLHRHRITMTYPLINASQHILFIVSGKGKAAILRDVLQGTRQYPAQGVHPVPGDLCWMIDQEAASQLTK
jgi:6-phosphogluconolactonase